MQPLAPQHPTGPEDRPDPNPPLLIVAPRRSLRKRLGLLPPLLIIVIALPVLAYRLLSPDWAWNRSAWNHWRSGVAAASAPLAVAPASKIQDKSTTPEIPGPDPAAEPPKVVANTPEPVEPKPAPAEESPKVVANIPEPAEPKPAPAEEHAESNEQASKSHPDAKNTDDSWDDIRREAERRQAEVARLEALKKHEAERLARESPDQVGRRGNLAARQREIEQFLDAQIAMQRRMMSEMLRRMPMGFDQDIDEMFNQFAREFQQQQVPMPGRAAPKQDRRRQPERSKQFSRRQKPGEIEIDTKFSNEVFHL